jgi:hypothetical protein
MTYYNSKNKLRKSLSEKSIRTCPYVIKITVLKTSSTLPLNMAGAQPQYTPRKYNSNLQCDTMLR